MSFQLMAWASRQTTGSPVRKAVLLALANRASHETGQCNPSVENIARETEYGVTAVKDALKKLAEDKIIGRRRNRRGDGSLGTYTYSFPLADEGRETADYGREAVVGLEPGGVPLEPGLDLLNREDLVESREAAPDGPPKLVKIDGRNLGFDALAEICGVAPGSPREREVAIALNGTGKIGERLGIRTLVWRSVLNDEGRERIASGDYPVVTVDGRRWSFEEFVAYSIRSRADAYRRRFPDIELTPLALRKWFVDLNVTPARGSPRPAPDRVCPDCGATQGEGHLEDCPRLAGRPKEDE